MTTNPFSHLSLSDLQSLWDSMKADQSVGISEMYQEAGRIALDLIQRAIDAKISTPANAVTEAARNLENAEMAVSRFIAENLTDIGSALRTVAKSTGDMAFRDLADEMTTLVVEWRMASANLIVTDAYNL